MNLIQITIISITVGKNPLEDMEESTKESEMQYLGAVSKMTELSSFPSFPWKTIQYHSNSSLCPNQ